MHIDTMKAKEPAHYNHNDQEEVIEIGKEIDYLLITENK